MTETPTASSGQTGPMKAGMEFYDQPKKPEACPFCGCTQIMTWHIGHYDKPWIAECVRCLADGPHADTENEAIRLWNGRVKE